MGGNLVFADGAANDAVGVEGGEEGGVTWREGRGKGFGFGLRYIKAKGEEWARGE